MFRKILTLLIAVNLVFLPEISFAQKRSSTRAKKVNSRNSTQNEKNSSQTKNSINTVSQQTNKEENSDEGKKLTCQEKFDLCMDNVCVNKLGIRSDCDTSIDTFETIEKDGEKFRIGNDLYTFARGVCNDTLKSCDLKERNHIETVYKAKIKEDTLTKNYLDAVMAGSDETQQAVLQEYFECMAPLCGNNFSDCFTIKNVERRAPNCQSVLSKTSKPLTVKGMFYKKLEEARSEFCKNSGGYLDYNSKICNIAVSYGSLEKIKGADGKEYYTGKMSKFVAKKYFKVGEIVECTQEYFNVMNTEKPLFERGILDMAMGAVKSVAGAALVVVGVLGTIFSWGAGSVETVPMIMNGASLMAKGTASTLNGAAKLNTDVRIESGCFINDTFASYMGQYFKVNFIN